MSARLPHFWVVTVLFNPCGYKRRSQLHGEFVDRCIGEGLNVLTVEVRSEGLSSPSVLFSRPAPLPSSSLSVFGHWVVLTAQSVSWRKEDAASAGIRHLPESCTAVAIVDDDLLFFRNDWPEETCKRLEDFKAVQCYGEIADLDRDGSVAYLEPSFMNFVSKGAPRGVRARAGGAWAFHRATIEQMGGLPDLCILGGNDSLLALALNQSVPVQAFPREMTRGFKDAAYDQVAKVGHVVEGRATYTPGGACHYYHGTRAARRYSERWEVLVRHQFDPSTDLRRAENGLWELTETGQRMQPDLQHHFAHRDEDL